MMGTITKKLIVCVPLVLAVLGLVLAAGCQPQGSSMATTRPSVAASQDQAVMCDKCKTVWVMQAHRNFKGMVTYRRKPKMVCPDCNSAAANFFKSGKLEHTCRSCGGSLAVCEGHRE